MGQNTDEAKRPTTVRRRGVVLKDGMLDPTPNAYQELV